MSVHAMCGGNAAGNRYVLFQFATVAVGAHF